MPARQAPDLPERSRPRREWPGTGHLGVLLRDPALAINELVGEALEAEGFANLGLAHLGIGQHIGDRGSRVTELAQLAQVTKPTVVYLVNELERHGYVERIPDPGDGRAKLVRLTPLGERAVDVARRTVAQVERDWAEAFGERDFERLRVLLRRLHDLLWPPVAG